MWEYKRDTTLPSRTKTLAIYRDMIYYAAPDGFIVALDAATGKVRWETKTDGGMTSGPVVIEGKVLTGRTCAASRKNCYISAHDALTGQEAWKFYTAAGDDDPGGASWGGAPEDKRFASTWGLPGNYDPGAQADLLGRRQSDAEHAGGTARRQVRRDSLHLAGRSLQQLDAGDQSDAPASWSWYYQHLPGDDWDEDYTHERTLLRTAVRPDPKFVKWINPDIRRGEQRDVAVMVGEGGGIFALDRRSGQFLWATPFPFDAPNFLITNVDGKTGKVTLNKDLRLHEPRRAPRHLLLEHAQLLADGVPSAAECPVRAVGGQLPRHDVGDSGGGRQAGRQREAKRNPARGVEAGGVRRPRQNQHGDRRNPAHIQRTGAGQRRRAGHGRRSRVLGRSGPASSARSTRSADKSCGRSTLGGSIDNSTIYVRGERQAVHRGDVRRRAPDRRHSSRRPASQPARRHNEIYVFALPDQR